MSAKKDPVALEREPGSQTTLTSLNPTSAARLMQSGDGITQTIEGGRSADAFIIAVRGGFVSPDALASQIIAMGHSPAKLRGFLRRLQKTLERVTP